MADSASAGQLESWSSALLALVFFPTSSSYIVRVICGVFICLAIAFLIPIILLAALDVCLWFWRLYWLANQARLRMQRRQHQQRQQQQLQEVQRRQQQLQKEQRKQQDTQPVKQPLQQDETETTNIHQRRSPQSTEAVPTQ